MCLCVYTFHKDTNKQTNTHPHTQTYIICVYWFTAKYCSHLENIYGENLFWFPFSFSSIFLSPCLKPCFAFNLCVCVSVSLSVCVCMCFYTYISICLMVYALTQAFQPQPNLSKFPTDAVDFIPFEVTFFVLFW